MGLDISTENHSFRAGSYSGFTDFRDWLAKQIGYENSNDYWNKNSVELKEWNNKQGMSKGAKDVILGPIMGHSDCDGFIPAKCLPKLKKELEDIKNKLISEDKWSDLVADAFTGSEDENDSYDEEEWNQLKLHDWILACDSKYRIEFH